MFPRQPADLMLIEEVKTRRTDLFNSSLDWKLKRWSISDLHCSVLLTSDSVKFKGKKLDFTENSEQQLVKCSGWSTIRITVISRDHQVRNHLCSYLNQTSLVQLNREKLCFHEDMLASVLFFSDFNLTLMSQLNLFSSLFTQPPTWKQAPRPHTLDIFGEE